MKKSRVKTAVQVKHCRKCVNGCPLDAPRCVTGRELAASGDIYEEVEIEEKSFLQKIFCKGRDY